MEKSLYEIFNDTEKKSIAHTEEISRIILTELEKKMGVSFGIDKEETPILLLVSLLTNLEFSYQTILLYLLEKYGVEERTLLLLLTTNLYRMPTPSILKLRQMAKLLLLPYIDDLSSNGNNYQIHTPYGTIEMNLAEDWFKEHHIDFEPQKFDGECHYAVEQMAPLLPDCYITTSEFPNLFGGIYYHSYYTLKEGGVVDPSRNIFYSGTCFMDVFKPKVLLEYPASELQERLKKYQEYAQKIDLENLDPVCALALEQKRKILK